MELKEFVKNVINDLTSVVEEINQGSKFETKLARGQENSNRTIEFDIAVTVEDSKVSSEKAGVKVLQIIEGGIGESNEIKNLSVSRIKFGVYVSNESKVEEAKTREEYIRSNREHRGF